MENPCIYIVRTLIVILNLLQLPRFVMKMQIELHLLLFLKSYGWEALHKRETLFRKNIIDIPADHTRNNLFFSLYYIRECHWLGCDYRHNCSRLSRVQIISLQFFLHFFTLHFFLFCAWCNEKCTKKGTLNYTFFYTELHFFSFLH